MKIILFLLICPFLLGQQTTRQKEMNGLTACIGAVISDNSVSKAARSFNKVTTDSRIEIYIYPECEAELFVFTRNDDQYVPYFRRLLEKDKLNKIPGGNNLISFDGEKKNETLLIVISNPGENTLKNVLEEKEELNLILSRVLQSEILTEKVPRMLTLGGNFRSLEKPEEVLKRYKGQEYIYKEYNFDVQN